MTNLQPEPTLEERCDRAKERLTYHWREAQEHEDLRDALNRMLAGTADARDHYLTGKTVQHNEDMRRYHHAKAEQSAQELQQLIEQEQDRAAGRADVLRACADTADMLGDTALANGLREQACRADRDAGNEPEDENPFDD